MIAAATLTECRGLDWATVCLLRYRYDSSRPVDQRRVPSLSSIIDPTSDRPAYRQIADHLRAAILGGRLAAGDQLPSERALMSTYGAARGTVRQAIATLRTEGLVDIEQGRGAFVRRRPPVQRKAYDRFARRHRDAGKAAYLIELEEEGRRPEVEVLEITPAPAPAEIARLLQVPEGSQVLVRRRRYLADGQPMELATSYLPWELVQGTKITEANTGPGGIYARLEEMGHQLKRFTEDVRARMPLPEEARALQLPPGVPVFLLVRVAYDVEDRPVEVCDTVMAADRYVLSYELPAR
jgi:GntR family transcriptional regulator